MRSRRLLLMAMPMLLSGCTTLFVGADDTACASDLALVQRTAKTAEDELARGMSAEARQLTLARMIDAASRARATCGYEVPDTPASDRARKPKPG